MGSACHQLGVYEVLPKLQALIAKYNLEDIVELKGAFCLENCSFGIAMKYGDCHFISVSPYNVEHKFIEEILPTIQAKNRQKS
jgi:NADH:ubiquinone oxidoreductase subunit E